MAHHFRPLIAAAVALVAAALAGLVAALAALVAWWAQQQHHRWLYHRAPRKRPKRR
jgi:hypothetical protein